MDETGYLLECQGIGKKYSARQGTVHALDPVTFGVWQGEFLCLVGPSGCGKTTLLKLLAGLLPPSMGRLRFAGGVSSPPATALVFQEHGLFPWMSIQDNVAFGLEMQGVGRRERRERARAFLEQMGLGSFVRHYPHQLSVGMRQRAAIARAFLSDPHLLLMDEPFSALDAQSKLVLQEDLLRIWKDRRKTVVYVTHDIEEAVLLGDRVLVLGGRPGRIRVELTVPLSRPRDLRNRNHPDVRELAWHIWKTIEADVRHNLALPNRES